MSDAQEPPCFVFGYLAVQLLGRMKKKLRMNRGVLKMDPSSNVQKKFLI